MAYEKGARRFRPVGSRKKKTAPKYGPTGTGCPVVEEAVARLYRDQSEAHFWDLMNALNYALELKTRVLVPLDAATDPQSGAAPWAALPIPEEKAEDLPPWLLHTRRERTYLPLFTSVKTAEAERTTATRPMAERGMREAMTYALNTEGLDGVVIDPWTNSATLDNSILKGLLRAARGDLDAPGADELDCGYEAACHGWGDEADSHHAGLYTNNGKPLPEQPAIRAVTYSGGVADCIYQGRGIRRSKTEARKLWKKAAAAGEVQAMIALGDDALASDKELAVALQYYRRAQSAGRGTPDVAYTPQIRLRIAQTETRFVSRRKALAELAEAEQGFRVQLEQAAPDAQLWLDETQKLTEELVAEANQPR